MSPVSLLLSHFSNVEVDQGIRFLTVLKSTLNDEESYAKLISSSASLTVLWALIVSVGCFQVRIMSEGLLCLWIIYRISLSWSESELKVFLRPLWTV